jgi:hypothetical protein
MKEISTSVHDFSTLSNPKKTRFFPEHYHLENENIGKKNLEIFLKYMLKSLNFFNVHNFLLTLLLIIVIQHYFLYESTIKPKSTLN